MKKITLKSLDDVHLPEGLFPAEISPGIESYIKSIVGELKEYEINQINFDLNTIRIGEYKIETEEITEDRGTLAGLKFRDIGKGENPQGIYGEGEFAERQLGKFKSFYLVYALFYVLKTIDDASIAKQDESFGVNAYFRLGKAYESLKYMEGYMVLYDRARTEVKTIKKKEERIKNFQRDSGRKGKRIAEAPKQKIQRRLVKEYLEFQGATNKFYKSHFVKDFIDALTNDDRKLFSATNIDRTFLDTIRRYENGSISPGIWPGDSLDL